MSSPCENCGYSNEITVCKDCDLYKGAYIEKTVIEDIKADIRALPKTYPFVNHFDTYVKDDDVIKIIDKHIGANK